ncbi:hypothetical protein V2J09_012753 [Rumex salicifolius]
MDENMCKICGECELEFTEFCPRFNCRGCGRWLCGSCVRRSGSLIILATTDSMGNGGHLQKVMKSCKFCSKTSWRYTEKIYPSDSPRGSPEPPSPPSDAEKVCDDRIAKRIYGDANGALEEGGHNFPSKTISKSSSFNSTFPVSVRFSPIRSDEETEDCGNLLLSPSNDYDHDSSDLDTARFSVRHERYNCRSAESSPSDSPSRINVDPHRFRDFSHHEKVEYPNSQNGGLLNQQMAAALVKPEQESRDLEHADGSTYDSHMLQNEKKSKKQLDFENNDNIWLPPPPEDENDESESNFFGYDDDDDEIGDSGGMFSSKVSVNGLFPDKEKQSEEQKEPIKSVIHGHFRALVSELLQGEGIKFSKQNENEDWLAIISNLAWQAANYVKPDTKKGGSMDPGAYVKIKCLASGKPDQSALIKGVVCTKNIKHKRMTSQYKHPRILLLGGSLEYQRAATELASFNMLLEEERNHLKILLSRIEAHRPNVLLVEKSVSPYAQECLLAKEISLVLNVKRHLLEKIAQCSGASITPADHINVARVGHCELFRLERVSEELEVTNQLSKRPSKTLMFFEGCPRRLGCTILLKGSCRDELKKIKHVVQYAVFAAYHLSLETSFLADEGASLPEMTLESSPTMPEDANMDKLVTIETNSAVDSPSQSIVDLPSMDQLSPGHSTEPGDLVSSIEHLDFASDLSPLDDRLDEISDNGQMSIAAVSSSLTNPDIILGTSCHPNNINSLQNQNDLIEVTLPGEQQSDDAEMISEQVSNEYFPAADSHESILVSFSNHCVMKGTVCERSRLLRIKFYGSFDKPLGRYLRDDLFDPASYCQSCKEPVEAHVQYYTHQQGSLTINVRRLSSNKLPGQQDGKIWMWHRCLQCAQEDGVPPATRRVVMSDAAWGLSFGKFLELSFSNHATANRIANCGHSLQRDCLRFYGCGNMVAFFHYSPIDILSVQLPPSKLEFDGLTKREWLKMEAAEIKSKMDTLYMEITGVLRDMEKKCASLCNGPSDCREQIEELKYLISKERNDYDFFRGDNEDTSLLAQKEVGILELNNLWHSLLINSHVWEYRFYSLDYLLKSCSSTSEASQDLSLHAELRVDMASKEMKSDIERAESDSDLSKVEESTVTSHFSPKKSASLELNASENCNVSSFLHNENADGEVSATDDSSEGVPSASALSDKIDSAWTGMDQLPVKPHFVNPISDDPHALTSQVNPDKLPYKRLVPPVRMYSFDSAVRLREKLHRTSLPSSLQLSAARSFHCSSDNRRDPLSGMLKTYSQISPQEAQRFSSILSSPLKYISGASHMAEGARLLLPQAGRNNTVIAVYDDEPTSIISYALSSREHEDWVCNKSNDLEGSSYGNDNCREDLTAASISTWPSFGSMDLDYIGYGSYVAEDASPRIGSLFYSTKKSTHLHVSFDDDTASSIGKAKFSVTCYFAKQFDMLRKKCCPNEVDIVCSLSRCKKWSAQGGKSNVYFAKSMDDRFIVKQVTKTELESFEEFAPAYFKYMTDSLKSRSPTCLAKVLGIYQVSVRNLKGGRETKMDLMVMENLFFERNISRIYDLKGSSRARYNSDTTGANKVLLDMNLLEALRTNPIFLGSKAKRTLERAVWNDTSFLASVDVMDYSLLVGVDEERKELVLGIIDFMRQYTWDKHLETWVKASGILGGPKNASPTIISPKQYKRRFRKAMTTYFLTVPDQWSSSKP